LNDDVGGKNTSGPGNLSISHSKIHTFTPPVRIYLNGFMASGKTSVGPRVAARLGLTFIDLDRLIRAHDGRPIPTIFAEDGEAAFRELEQAALRRTAEPDDLVVALGGGALVADANRAFAREHGRIVHLEVGPETVLERVGDEADQRPLLQDEAGTPLPRDQMRDRVETLLSDRRAAYTDAHATVDATQSLDDVVAAVVAAAQERGWVE
jgi:shikimate kinase